MNIAHGDGSGPDDLDTNRWIGARMMTGGLITALFVLLSPYHVNFAGTIS